VILIKNIEFIETPRDPWEIFVTHLPHEVIPVEGNSGPYAEVSVLTELVRGRRFLRPSDGTDIVVGLAKDAQNILGLQYEAWENMAQELKDTRSQMRQLQRERDRARGATIWTRFEWLLFGYKDGGNG